jgi:hypothetical protein
MVEKAPLLGEVEMTTVLDHLFKKTTTMEGLENIRDAVSREWSIRKVMAETGEDRQTVIDTMGAIDSMDQEAVLALTSGAPTTLADGLQAYIESLPSSDGTAADWDVASDLHALLMYPWPEEEATIATHGANASVGLRVQVDEHRTCVYVGGQKVADIPTQDAYVKAVVQEVAEAVHRAVLARVIGDRPHHVSINQTDRLDLLNWLDRPNGSWSAGGTDRLSVNALEGGGILVRTSPFTHVTPPRSRPSVDTLQS